MVEQCMQLCPCVCAEPPEWSAWGQWSECSETCGDGTETRQRTCVPSDCDDGSDCPGEPEEYRPCNLGCCEGLYWQCCPAPV